MARAAHGPSTAARRLGLALGIAALLATGCGSTVATSQQQAAGQALGQTPSGGQLTGGQNPTGTTGGEVVPGQTTTASAGTTTLPGGGTQTGSAAGSGSGGAPVTGPGSNTAKATGPIEIGFIGGKCSNCGAVLGSKYAQGAYSDTDFNRAMVNGLNARGGIAGRKIKPVYAEVDTASPDWSSDFQAACATFTEDHHVVAVLGLSFAYMENFASCLAKAGVVWINGGNSGGDKQVYRNNPKYFTNIAPTEDVELLVSVTSAVEDGWVTPKSRLGILQADCPADQRAYNNTLKPYLAAHHLNMVSNQTIKCVSGAQDDGNAVTFIQHAELQMRSDGVDNVIIVGIPLILFAENAESQQWHPKYLAFFGGAVYEPYLPPAQLANIHGAGWLPSFDLNASHQPPLSPVQRTCRDLIVRGGADTPAAQYSQAFTACDSVLLYARAVQAAGGDASPAAVTRQLDALGTSYVSAMSLSGATTLGPGHHDAPAAYRSNTYSSSCSCFQYAGPSRPFPKA
ncbi:MAG: hypothetical protein QOE97_3766 [Pseudonocardiales bacterium]|nr:hypothetical protein [Pseudonocardiales bacterium]